MQKILIVDDSEVDRAILADVLQEEYQIIEAENGAKAVEILGSGEYVDLVLLDIMMPKMNGFEVLEEMKQRQWIDKIPVIMISTEGALSNIHRAYNHGAIECICRPFDSTIVRRRVANALMLYSKLDKFQLGQQATQMKNFQHKEQSASDRTLSLIESEQAKSCFFAQMSREIQFEYIEKDRTVIISDWGVKQLGLSEITMNPYNDERIIEVVGKGNLRQLGKLLLKTSPEFPVVHENFQIKIKGEYRWYRFVCMTTWSKGGEPKYMGAIGKIIDIDEEQTKFLRLQYMAQHDSLTELYTHVCAKEQIECILSKSPNSKFAMILLDLDNFKQANDNLGHMFGDNILKYTTRRLKECVRTDDIAARNGGDEFLIFFEYKNHLESVVSRIFNQISGKYKGYEILISMGVATTETAGNEYNALFHQADQAVYAAKLDGRGRFRFYDDSMKSILSAISAINHSED